MNAATDPELALPVRHEALARRVAELVTAELAPSMTSAILAPGVLGPVWDWLGEAYSSGRWAYHMPPAGVGPHVLESYLELDPRRRSVLIRLRGNGCQLWSAELHE